VIQDKKAKMCIHWKSNNSPRRKEYIEEASYLVDLCILTPRKENCHLSFQKMIAPMCTPALTSMVAAVSAASSHLSA